MTNLLDRYDEAVAVQLADPAHLRRQLAGQDRIALALDGLQPDVGHEVLWVLRDYVSGMVLLARSLLSGTAEDLAVLVRPVIEAAGLPVAGVISDGQHSIRKAVAMVLPDVPHQLCHFHSLRGAALPIFEADRHAEKELKKGIRGVRPIERVVEGRMEPEANRRGGVRSGADRARPAHARRWPTGSGPPASPPCWPARRSLARPFGGSGRRRPRTAFFIDGRRGSPARRYPVAVLIDALAAAAGTVSLRRNCMKSLIW